MEINPILYQNEINKFSNVYKDYQTVCNHICQQQQNISIFDMFPLTNRITGVEKNKHEHKKLANVGFGVMALINLPEDFRDLTDVVKQIKSEWKGDNSFVQPYDYSKAQHPFSLFRGSLMRNLINYNKNPFPRIVEKLRNADKTMLDTKLGENFLCKNKITYTEIPTKIFDVASSERTPFVVKAKQFAGGNPFTELTARALIRTPKLGVLAYSAIETANCVDNVVKGQNPFKSIYNSTIDLTSSIVGMGYGGAFGAKHFGAAGSVIGMGIGTILGKLTAKELKFS